MKQNNLFIITESYPYTDGGEQFLYNEFQELSNHYKKIYVFPLHTGKNILKDLPENIFIHNSLDSTIIINKLDFLKEWKFLFSAVLIEIFNNGGKFLKDFRANIASLKKSILLSKIILKDLEKLNYSFSDTLMSTWMNIGALTLTNLKFHSKISKFSFRVNGYDIFEERHKWNYLPFRAFNYKYTHKVIVLSKAGLDEIKSKKIHINKLIQNYSGLYDIGNNPFNKDNIFTLVSCSNIIPLKRVHLIAKALQYIDFKLNWIHFGDGSEMNTLKKITSSLPNNINVNLKGKVKREKIINFYLNNSINLFIHTSETEGLGMAIIEAQSFSIPTMGCDVGGVPEIINENSGILLPEKVTPKEISKAIIHFKKSELNSVNFRQKVKLNFKAKFNIKSNINTLINELE